MSEIPFASFRIEQLLLLSPSRIKPPQLYSSVPKDWTEFSTGAVQAHQAYCPLDSSQPFQSEPEGLAGGSKQQHQLQTLETDTASEPAAPLRPTFRSAGKLRLVPLAAKRWSLAKVCIAADSFQGSLLLEER